MDPGDEGGRQDVNTATIIRKKWDKNRRNEARKHRKFKQNSLSPLYPLTQILHRINKPCSNHKPLPYLMFIAIQC